MKATDQGIELTKADLVALLAHASKDDALSGYWIGFRVRGGRVEIEATDGHRGIRVSCAAWAGDVDRAFEIERPDLDRLVGAIGRGRLVVRLPRDADAAAKLDVIDPDGGLHMYGCPVRTQAYPRLDALFRAVVATDTALGGCVALNGDYLAAVSLVSAAANEENRRTKLKRGESRPCFPVVVYPTIDPMDPVYIACDAPNLDAPAEWRVLIMPVRFFRDDRELKRARKAAVATKSAEAGA